MSGLSRPGVASRRTNSSMRPPPRPTNLRAQTSASSVTGRASPADSLLSVSSNSSRMNSSNNQTQAGGVKRKERDFEREALEETNINVVVRCRGRNDREVRENSGVVVSADGIIGRNVELSMGPSALSNKTYQFDKVFSSAADQFMVFDEVVTPILDEVLNGFNCTIFAYGQTGTGKTYTMSGDISEMLPPPDSAGIIPRVLHSLFARLEGDEASENSVKCSFIELYNEELRDLLSADDSVKLKIFDDANKKAHASTMVQGMEETHIRSATKGIQLLRRGSHKRQVAATKCNDLSSRSHTVFTITVYIKRTTDTGEEVVSAGKLNLVDLAGSENIQRSGAENKRATEAGLINKSLLTLGRVINALVDKSPHIPYRESKLTRLLQDSLGGRTKTCIIATLSPAKSNLEETISTLDYAFRAKNIRNKPQINGPVSKKTLLKEFTTEIEKLKSELIATRQRNGVYLTAEQYEEMTTESESRRILSEERRDRIETMEANLRNKVQELFTLTTRFQSLKKDNESTKSILEGTKTILEKTEAVLDHTRQNLSEETALRKAHQQTEQNLANIGEDLISTLGKTTGDLGGLHSKLRRRSDLQSRNRKNWTTTQDEVSQYTLLADRGIEEFQAEQSALVDRLSQRMKTFVADELEKLGTSQSFLQEKAESFDKSEKEVNDQTAKARDEMNDVLEEIKTLRQDVKEKVGAGLNDLSNAAQRISTSIITELDAFHTQLHASYAALGRDFKTTFDDLVRELNEQKTEVDRLRAEKAKADVATEQTLQNLQSKMVADYEEEKRVAASERETLMSQMMELVNKNAQSQEARLTDRIGATSNEIGKSNATIQTARNAYNSGMDDCAVRSADIVEGVNKSRDNVKAKIKADFASANEHTTSLRQTTASVHESTVRIVDEQMSHMDTQLHSLDDIVSRIRAQNNSHHSAHTSSLSALASNVQSSYDSIGEHLKTSFSRTQNLGSEIDSQSNAICSRLTQQLAADGTIRLSLSDLRSLIASQNLEEYIPTGQTPARVQYDYPVSLPRTEDHGTFLAKLRGETIPEEDLVLPPRSPSKSSPTKGLVFSDNTDTHGDEDTTKLLSRSFRSRPNTASSGVSLRELDVNTVNLTADLMELKEPALPPLKRQNTSGLDKIVVPGEGKLPAATVAQMKKRAGAPRKTVATLHGVVADGRENVPLPAQKEFSASVGAGAMGSRRLRSHDRSS